MNNPFDLNIHLSRRIVLAMLLVVSLLLVETAEAQSPLPYQTYLARVGRWREQVREAQGQAATGCAQVLGEVAAEMAGVTAVQMPNGMITAVNHEGILTALRAFPCDPARADSLLAGICPSQTCPIGEAPLNPEPPDPADELPFGSDALPLPEVPSQDITEAMEQLLQEADSEGAANASGDDNSEQLASAESNSAASADESEAESGIDGEAAGGENGEQTANTGEGTGEETADSGAETAESGETASSEGSESGEDDSVGTGNSGDEGNGGDASGSGGAASDSSSGTNSSGEGGGETAVTAPDSTGANPSSPAQPPVIAPPTATARPLWLWLIVGLAVVVLIIGAVLLLGNSGADDGQKERRVKAKPETPEEAVDEGRALIAAGDYRGAVRHLFLAALLTLDERHLIQYDKTRTNYELLGETTLRPAIVETLVPIIETFERVWYGFETVGAAEYEALAGQIELLKQV